MDEIDKKIIKHLSRGVYSYGELAELCGVHRNTVIRRIGDLEEKGIIKHQIGAIVDFDKLNLSTVVFGLNLNPKDLERTANFLKKQPQIKLLWKTYGSHDMIFAMVCDKSDVGICIFKLKEALAGLDIEFAKLDSSTSFTWEKIDLNPF